MQNKKWLKFSRTLLIVTASIGLVISVAMFIFLGVFMNKKSNSTMNEAGEMFMTGIGRQMVMRFDSVIEQRTTMVDGLRKTYAPNPDDPDSVKSALETAAKARSFDYLAYMGDDGKIEMVYGAQVTLVDPDPFINSLNTIKETKVAVATDGEGNKGVVLIGVPTENGYTMQGGKKSAALICGLKNTEISNMLAEKNSDDSETQSFDTHIIRRNGGTFVMGGTADGGHNHINPSSTYLDELKSFGLSEKQAKQLWDTLQQKMSLGDYYSTVINTENRKHLYCEKLSHSEWYLVTVMEYTDLDAIVGGLSGTWTGFTVGACLMVILVLAAIFLIYFLINRRNQKELIEARITAEEASKAKSEFLSNMSHDIRTPMNAIVGMTAIATANMDNPKQVSDCLRKIAVSSRHLLGLINDVLDMSKIESGKMTLNMEQISLSEVIDGITTIIKPQIKIKRQNFDIYVHDIIQENVYCDSVRLNQVIMNLLSNAHKFTPEEGTIEMSVFQEPSTLGDDYVRTHIEVKDSGIGMSKEFLKNIFEPFVREDNARVNKTEGTGLGMPIAKFIVDSMHGNMDVESELGKGTTFKITLDLEKAEVAEVDMVLPAWKMLVVDDDKMLCDTTVASLQSIGINAESTLDGESAIKMATKAHAAGSSYDVILLDWKLPEIDGIETARRLRKKLGENIPIMLISAYDWSEIEEEAREAGINGFIAKPLFKSTLYYGLRQFASDAPVTVDKQKEAQIDLTGKHILVAEDNDLDWEIAKLLLESVGLVVDHAENGQICLDMLLASKPGTYDAILMDIRMPVMNGLEATKVIRTLKKGYRDIPVIAMTADAFSEDVQKCLEAGMNAHIAKPIELDVIQATLAKFINKKPE